MGEAKRRRQVDENYGKKQPVKVEIKKKVSPLTGRDGYLVLLKFSNKHKLDGFFYYSYEEALKASSILNLTFNNVSRTGWVEYFKKEGDACYPQSLIPTEIFNKANELPGIMVTGDETVEIIAYSEHTLATNVGNRPEADFLEIMIPVNSIVPEQLPRLMREDNILCLRNQWPLMWEEATIGRIEVRSQVEIDLIEDWSKAGIDMAMIIGNIHHAKQEVIRKNGGWY